MSKVSGAHSVAVVDRDTPDPTTLDYTNHGIVPFLGAVIEDGWHYVTVAEHPAALALGSNKVKFLRMGYEIAPADPDTRAMWDEAKQWAMRIRQEIYDARVARSRQQSKENAAAKTSNVNESEGLHVVRSESTKKSLADLGVDLSNG